jgi:cytochrome c556
MNIRLAGLAALACCVAGVAIARAEVDVIAIHKAGMDLQGAALGAANQALKAGVDVKSLANTGSAIAAWAKQIPSVYPPEANKGEPFTKALPLIWTDNAGFTKAAANLGAAADKLTAAAKAEDKAAFADALKEVGEACGACHKTYRAK